MTPDRSTTRRPSDSFKKKQQGIRITDLDDTAHLQRLNPVGAYNNCASAIADLCSGHCIAKGCLIETQAFPPARL